MFNIYGYELVATGETDPRKRVLIGIFTEEPNLSQDDAIAIVSKTHPYVLNHISIQDLRRSQDPVPTQFESRETLPNGVIYYRPI